MHDDSTGIFLVFLFMTFFLGVAVGVLAMLDNSVRVSSINDGSHKLYACEQHTEYRLIDGTPSPVQNWYTCKTEKE